MEKLYDNHIHTISSFDGNDNIDSICRSVIKNKISGIAITDHCDMNGYNESGLGAAIKASVDNAVKAKEKYKNSLDVICGIELGQPLQNLSETEKLMENLKLDFTLASLHNINNYDDFYYIDYKAYDVYYLLDRYFNELLEMVMWGNFDCLAHLTYPVRYICGEHKIKVDLKRYDDIVEHILKLLVTNGKALEINTSGLFQPLAETIPGKRYIKLFKEVGGEFITIGSDSHFGRYAGRGILDGAEIAVDAGFNYCCYYKNHIPSMIKL